MPSLSLGASGSDVRRLQAALVEAGYLQGEVDGKFGPGTEAAVREFQQSHGLTADGKVGAQTRAALEVDTFEDDAGGSQAPQPQGDAFESQPQARGTVSGTLSGTVQRGSSGDDARRVQQALVARGYDVGMVDGKFGAKCEAAVRAFQAANGLTADGKVGRQTAAKLGLGMDADAVTQVGTDTGSSRTVLVARMDRYPGGVGMATGSITLNGHTYRFNSGKAGKYFSSPKGTYNVTRQGSLSDHRGGTAFSRGGIGFSFIMEDVKRPGSDRMWDSRAGRQRGALRIHPDGGSAGTQGCLGIIADGAELKRFQRDLNAALRANGGRLTLEVV